jgi:outer membrane biogenesis lipoprotein LolB
MKRLTITLTLLSALALLAGCHDGGGSDPTAQQQLQQAQQHLMQQQTATGNWQLAAGILAVSCILLFLIGAMLGSRTRRNRNDTNSHEQ